MNDSIPNRLMALKDSLALGEISKFQYADELMAHHAFLFSYPDFLANTDVEEVRLTADGVTVRSRAHGISMYIDAVDLHTTAYALLNRGRYERAETDFLKSVFHDGDIFIDVGANRGWFSLILAEQSPGGRVFAFEPIPSTFQGLKDNVELNDLKNIEPICMGMFDRADELNFLFAKDASGATSLKLAGQSRGHAKLQEITCPTTTLDAFCTSRNLIPSLIKVDIEGAELMVAQGGREILAHTPILLMELLRKWAREFDYHPNDVFALLEAYGYEAWVFSLENPGKLERCYRMTEETVQTNFIFLHPDRHAAVIEKWI